MADETTSNQKSPLAQEVEKMLRLQDASSMAGSMGKLLPGLGVCLAAGFVFATIMWIMIGWWRVWFWLYLLVVAALIILYERKSRTKYVDDALGSVNANSSSISEGKFDQFILGDSPVSTIILWGPRAIVDGFRGLRGQRTLLQHAVFERAVLLVLDLSRSQVGIDVQKLLYPPEDMETFGLAVEMLETHGWIGKASDGKSLWLNSSFRQKLREFTASHPM